MDRMCFATSTQLMTCRKERVVRQIGTRTETAFRIEFARITIEVNLCQGQSWLTSWNYLRHHRLEGRSQVIASTAMTLTRHADTSMRRVAWRCSRCGGVLGGSNERVSANNYKALWSSKAGRVINLFISSDFLGSTSPIDSYHVAARISNPPTSALRRPAILRRRSWLLRPSAPVTTCANMAMCIPRRQLHHCWCFHFQQVGDLVPLGLCLLLLHHADHNRWEYSKQTFLATLHSGRLISRAPDNILHIRTL